MKNDCIRIQPRKTENFGCIFLISQFRPFSITMTDYSKWDNLEVSSSEEDDGISMNQVAAQIRAMQEGRMSGADVLKSYENAKPKPKKQTQEPKIRDKFNKTQVALLKNYVTKRLI